MYKRNRRPEPVVSIKPPPALLGPSELLFAVYLPQIVSVVAAIIVHLGNHLEACALI